MQKALRKHAVDELRDFDPDAAEARLVELAHIEEGLARDEKERYAERDRLLRERDALEGGVGAEVVWQQRRNAEAREWLMQRDAGRC